MNDFSVLSYLTLGRTSAAIHRTIRDNSYHEGEGKVGKGKITAVEFTDEICDFSFHWNTSFFGLDAPHHTPTQDAKQGAKMTNF